MKTPLFASQCVTIVTVLVCLGLNSCVEDERILPSLVDTTLKFRQNAMDTIMFNVLADNWHLIFDDTINAVLGITVHPGYNQPDPVNQYGANNLITRGYEVMTSLTFENKSTAILMEGHHPGDYPYYYFFKVYPSIGIYPYLEFNLFYEYSGVSTITGVFYNNSGVARHFTGTN